VLDKSEKFDIGLEKAIELGGIRKQASDQVLLSHFDGSGFVSQP